MGEEELSTYPPSLQRLIELFQNLPGLGPKSAQRLAFHLLKQPSQLAESLAEALRAVKTEVKTCSVCFNYSQAEKCPICLDERRDASTICVVATPTDLMALERTAEYNGVYHVLQGLISPLDGISAEDIRVKELLQRVEAGQVSEVIMALNPVVEGDATAMYIAPLFKEKGIKVSRLALGLPVGGDLDYADRLTISMALQGRREM